MAYLGDLSISVSLASGPNRVLNGGPPGATFPGWFLHIVSNEGYDIHGGTPVQIPAADALRFAQLADEVLAGDKVIRGAATPSRFAVESAVKGANSERVRRLEEIVNGIRAQAEKLPRFEAELEAARADTAKED